MSSVASNEFCAKTQICSIGHDNLWHPLYKTIVNLPSFIFERRMGNVPISLAKQYFLAL